jgi:uncharacterized protein (DUF1810 family)
MADHDLGRFVAAQQKAYPQALAELRRGRKEGHWIWFVFPQLAGLGRSANSRHYGLSGLDEARAYLAHELLGPRLREATQAVLAHRGIPAEAMFGPLDAMKFRSSMTLFDVASGSASPFAEALEAYYRGERDPATLEMLARP